MIPDIPGKYKEARGRSTATDIRGLEKAIATAGYERLQEVLYSRNNQRWENVYKRSGVAWQRHARVLAPIPVFSSALHALGISEARRPSDPTSKPLSQVAWGLDSCLSAVRMLVVGQTLGAATIMRQQLERWTLNLASNRKLTRAAHESRTEFIDRVWSPYSDGNARMGTHWNRLSEFMHARGPHVELVRWEECSLLAKPLPSATPLSAPVIEACIWLLRGLIATTWRDAGGSDRTYQLVTGVPSLLKASSTLKFPSESLFPLSLKHLTDGSLSSLDVHQDAFSRHLRSIATRGKGTASLEDLVVMSFIDCRRRARDAARDAFRAEEEAVGEDYEPMIVQARYQQTILLCEMMALLATWDESTCAAEWRCGAGSLRSAFFLWLEDDDNAFTLTRSLIESLAKTRTTRIKPARAARLRARGRLASPRDWIEAAGWKRLRLVNRALGELSHTTRNSKARGAREALRKTLPDSEKGPSPDEYLVRGGILRAATAMAAQEISLHLDHLSPRIAGAFRDIVSPNRGLSLLEEDRWLDKVWEQREDDLGRPVEYIEPQTLEDLLGPDAR